MKRRARQRVFNIINYLIFAIIIISILWFYKKRMGCITGDMLGAMIELTEAGMFLTASIGG